MRESKMIPSLIYSVEKYDQYVIQLAKKSKVGISIGHNLNA